VRLFLALGLPDAWLREAERALDALTAALGDDADVLRPVALDRMHLTVRFLGEVDEDALPALDAALREQVPPVGVDLQLAEAGTFGSAARTSVVWLGLGGDIDALRALGNRVEVAVEAAGLPSERRELRPHITLARVRQRASAAQRRAIAAAVAALDVPARHPHRASEVVLVRSHLGSGQPRYEVLGRY
jgi:2'-5' RNA ligase